MTKEQHKQPDLELFVGNKNGQILSGDVPVRWCVSPTLLAELEQRRVQIPKILVVATTEKGREVGRIIERLDKLMSYIRCTRAGTITLHAWIINGDDEQLVADQYQIELFSGNQKPYKTIKYFTRMNTECEISYTYTSVNICIPEDAFATEPPGWLTNWVNLWHTTTVKDQCEFRRRAILSIFKAPVVGSVILWKWLLVFLSLMLTTLLGTRIQSFDAEIAKQILKRPLSTPLSKLLTDDFCVASDFIFKNNNRALIGFTPIFHLLPMLVLQHGTVDRAFIIVSIVECVLIFGPGIVEIVSKFSIVDEYFTKRDMWPSVLVSAAGILIGLLLWTIYLMPVVMLLLISAIVITTAILSYITKYIEKKRNITAYDVKELLCTDDEYNHVADIHNIPKQQRTFWLWFKSLKHNVCKPMQR